MRKEETREDKASSLRCYLCQAPSPSMKCTIIQNCHENQTVCKTIVHESVTGFPFQEDKTIISFCAEECTPSDTSWFAIRRPVYCCNYDLCNRFDLQSGTTSVHLNYLAILAASLLCILLTPKLFM
uniref:Ly6/PLAUR domain-containing protein 2-like n=1 Tax=Geotrypetes seraphini TaxID=260995 RepID=A0A6P8PMV2_GEOSA|nr:ly6/PLAUR domain-containing protein 2-like [Geotrypetes seraphini]